MLVFSISVSVFRHAQSRVRRGPAQLSEDLLLSCAVLKVTLFLDIT